MFAKRFLLILLLFFVAVPLTADQYDDLEDKIKDAMKNDKLSSAEKAGLIRQLKGYNTDDNAKDAVELCFKIIKFPNNDTAKLEKEKENLLKEVDKLEKLMTEIASRVDATGRVGQVELQTYNECVDKRDKILNEELPKIEDRLRAGAAMKNAAIYVLQRLKHPDAKEMLLKGLEDRNWKIVYASLEAFKYQKWPKAYKGLVKLYPLVEKPHKNAQVRALTLSTMQAIISEEGIADKYVKRARNTFILALEDESWIVRSSAVKGLGFIADKDCVGPLIDALDRESGRLKWDIVKILQNITGKKFADDVKAWRAWWKTNKESFEPVKKGDDASEGRVEGSHKTAEFYKIKLVSNAPIFVIDHSGSMVQPADTEYYKKLREEWEKKLRRAQNQGTSIEPPPVRPVPPHKSRWEVLQIKLKKAIEGLNEKDATFNIVWYSNNVEVFNSDMCRASKGNKKKAIKQIDGMKPEGMTNIYDALKKAFEIAVGAEPGKGGGAFTNDKGELYSDTIFFLTDGYPTWGPIQDPDEIRKAVKEWNTNLDIKIHCIGIGIEEGEFDYAEETEFLKKLASDNNGKCQFINREKDSEDNDDDD